MQDEFKFSNFSNWMVDKVESSQREKKESRISKKTEWPKFGAAVLTAAIKSIAVALIGGGFLFYSYADPLSNLFDANMVSPLLDLNPIAILCQQDQLKKVLESDEGVCKFAAVQPPDAPSKQGGGAQSTQYICQLPRSRVPHKIPTEPECQIPYSYYPGRERVQLMLEYSRILWDKISEEVAAERRKAPAMLWNGWPIFTRIAGTLNWLFFWIGRNGKIPTTVPKLGADKNNRGGAFATWFARTTALTWSSYRYILACLFTGSLSIKREQVPFFQIQFFAYLYAGFMAVLAQTVIPLILPFLTIFYQLFDLADECTNKVAPGLPSSINVLYTLLPLLFGGINFIIIFTALPVVGILYFIYLILLAPMRKDKKLYLATLQCNQNFIALLFATLVVLEGRQYLDSTTGGAFIASYVILLLYYLYKNKDWFTAILST